MLIPSRTKYRRVHRLPYEGKAKGNVELHLVNMVLWLKKELGLQLTKLKQLVLL